MKIRFTPSAMAQFLSALTFIRRDNPSAAIRFRDRTETALRRLEEFPESGRVVPEFPDLPYREVVISPYRFFTESKIMWSGSLQFGMADKLRENQGLARHFAGG